MPRDANSFANWFSNLKQSVEMLIEYTLLSSVLRGWPDSFCLDTSCASGHGYLCQQTGTLSLVRYLDISTATSLRTDKSLL